MRELQDRYERLRSLPSLLGGGVLHRSSGFQEYVQLSALYTTIAEGSGKKVIVDSTKYPGRALAISRIPGIDSRVV